jgi:hypothetical protein
MRRRNFSRRGVLKGSTAAALTLYAAPLRAAPTRGQLALRDRIFEVSSAEISKVSDGIWSVDIETRAKVYDEENWAPRLYHQGLRFNAVWAPDLAGQSTSWRRSTDANYPHPEVGLIYVFGHHDVYNCELRFGLFRNGRLALAWVGLCEVLWDELFQDDVPFKCRCELEVTPGKPVGPNRRRANLSR